MTASRPLEHLKEHTDIIEKDLSLIRARAPAGARLLDIGAGRGAFVKAAVRRGFDAIGLEMEASAPGLWSREGVAGVVAEGASAPFAGCSFDVVRMKEVIEHVEAPLALVNEAKRLLRPGGLLVMHTPSPYSQFYPVGNFWDDYTHVRPFSGLALRRLVADAGLELESIQGYVSGRNGLERALGRLLALVLPHTYRVLCRRAG